MVPALSIQLQQLLLQWAHGKGRHTLQCPVRDLHAGENRVERIHQLGHQAPNQLDNSQLHRIEGDFERSAVAGGGGGDRVASGHVLRGDALLRA